MCENRDFLVPVNMLTLFVHTLFSLATWFSFFCNIHNCAMPSAMGEIAHKQVNSLKEQLVKLASVAFYYPKWHLP